MGMENESTDTTQTTAGATDTTTQTDAVSGAAAAGGTDNSGTQAASADKTPGVGNPPPAEGNGSGDAANITDTWKPSLKFKVKDKELEFDPLFKDVIKSKDQEAKMRELYEKAHGLDEVKTRRDALTQELATEKQKLTQVDQSLKNLGTLVQRKDYGTFFDILKIPKADIIQYAIQELKYQELPADQKAAIDQQRQMQQQFFDLQAQNQAMQQQLQGAGVQQTNFEIDQAINAPEVAAIAQAFDARAGKPGAFREELLKRGQYYENVHRISPPASQLAAELINLMGATAQVTQGQAAPSQGTQGQQAQVVQNQQQKPVIPSFQGGSTNKSATKKVPMSTDDLRKMRQERLQQQG